MVDCPFLWKGNQRWLCWKLRPELQEAMRELVEISISEEIKFEHSENIFEGAIITYTLCASG